MPKSKSKRKTAAASSGKGLSMGAGAAGSGRLNLLLAGLAVVALAAGGWWWWQNQTAEARFMDLAAAGQAALSGVVEEANQGNRHLEAGETHVYAEDFPTSGPHAKTPADTGFYGPGEAPPKIQLVHALEHGHVIAYYDTPGAEALDHLKDWAAHYGGHWDGMLAVPAPRLGSTVVMAAWRKRLDLDPFDPAAAAAFIDAYRGRGPENPVR
jgi:hypothetical protein